MTDGHQVGGQIDSDRPCSMPSAIVRGEVRMIYSTPGLPADAFKFQGLRWRSSFGFD